MYIGWMLVLPWGALIALYRRHYGKVFKVFKLNVMRRNIEKFGGSVEGGFRISILISRCTTMSA